MIPASYKPATWNGTTATDDQGQVGIGIKTTDGIVHRFLLNAESAQLLSGILALRGANNPLISSPSTPEQNNLATAYHTDDYSRIDCSAVIVQGQDELYRLRIHAPGEEGQLGHRMEGYRRGSQNHILDLLRAWMNSKSGDNRPGIQQSRQGAGNA